MINLQTTFDTILSKIGIGLIDDQLPEPFQSKERKSVTVTDVPEKPTVDNPLEQWRFIDYTDPRYHKSERLTPDERMMLIEKDCTDFAKAEIIKAKMEEGYAISEAGYSNSQLSKQLSAEVSDSGYSKDTVKKYAAVFRKSRADGTTTPLSVAV